jgi:parallel beta-helix repeat protein
MSLLKIFIGVDCLKINTGWKVIVEDEIIRKCLSVLIIILFVGIITFSATAQITEKFQLTSKGNWLYVGGNGPENYSKIQDAIDNASDGDIVFVYDDSSPYVDPVIIHKSITLMGEDKNTTIIDGNQEGPHGSNIEITADSVIVSNFTFLNTKGYYEFSIIKIHSNDNQISNNIFNPTQYCRGIYIFNGDRNFITENIFNGIYNDGIIAEYANNTIITENICGGKNSGIVIDDSSNNIVLSNQLVGTYFIGIFIRGRNNTVSENCICHAEDSTLAAGIKVVGLSVLDINTIFKNEIKYCENGILTVSYSSHIKENIISNCHYGIWLLGSTGNIISKNNISNNEDGIHVSSGILNIISYNTIVSNNVTGIMLWGGFKNEILNNNICWNTRNAQNLYCKRPRWNGNYWGETMTLPKIFFGTGRIRIGTSWNSHGHPEEVYFYFPKINIDWHPAPEPYFI